MPGAQNLYDFEALGDLLKIHAGKGKVAAICAAPAVVLAPLGILKDREATCYPGFEDQLLAGGARHRDAPVVALDNLITANGPASALRFGRSAAVGYWSLLMATAVHEGARRSKMAWAKSYHEQTPSLAK